MPLPLSWLFSSSSFLLADRRFGPRDKRPDNANYSQAKEQYRMLNMHMVISNHVVDAWNEEEYSEGDTNDCQYNSSVEDCRVLHSFFCTFLQVIDEPLMGKHIITDSLIFSSRWA